MIEEFFCQCISEDTIESDQCIRIDCPCEETDCVWHNDIDATISGTVQEIN